MKPLGLRVAVIVLSACAVCLLTLGVASAASWVDEMSNSLIFYQTTYPTSNFEPYHNKLIAVRNALGRDDEKAVRGEIGELFKMLRARSHDINDVAADELISYWQTLVPTEELKTSTPFMIERVPDTRDYNRDQFEDNAGGCCD